MQDNSDKIKVLEKALNILKLEVSLYFGICDAINQAVMALDYTDVFRSASFYGIELPKRKYYNSTNDWECFSFPCTLEGRQQRIEVLQEAIKKLKS